MENSHSLTVVPVFYQTIGTGLPVFAQQTDAKDKKQQSDNDETADGHRRACLTHASFLAVPEPGPAEVPDAPRVRKRRACSSVCGSLTSREGLPAAVTRRVLSGGT